MRKEKNNSSMGHDRLEIRSPKVRRLLEQPPHPVLKWGIVALVIIFILLIGYVLSLPYPYSTGESIWEHIVG